MAFRISKYRDTEFNDINGTNVWNLETTVFCDTTGDLPTPDEINNYHLVIGCKAIIVTNGDKYYLGGDGTWNKAASGGGGGGSVTVDTQVLPDSPNPVQNQAIYAFVNSSVATNTASFQGTYHTLAELEAVQNPTNNDYGFVIDVQSVVLLDTEPTDWSTNWTDYYIYDDGEYVPVSGDIAPTFAQNTYYKADGVVYKRYKYNASDEQWEFEYDLNNSSFTAAEWATIQSGLTAADKVKYDGYESLIEGKATKATTIAGYGITDAKFAPSTGTITLGSNTLVPVRTIQINGTTQTNTTGTVNLPAYPTTLPASDTTNTYSPSGTVPVSGQAVASAISTKADLSMFTAMSESDYEALVTKDRPLYFIYED